MYKRVSKPRPKAGAIHFGNKATTQEERDETRALKRKLQKAQREARENAKKTTKELTIQADHVEEIEHTYMPTQVYSRNFQFLDMPYS